VQIGPNSSVRRRASFFGSSADGSTRVLHGAEGMTRRASFSSGVLARPARPTALLGSPGNHSREVIHAASINVGSSPPVPTQRPASGEPGSLRLVHAGFVGCWMQSGHREKQDVERHRVPLPPQFRTLARTLEQGKPRTRERKRGPAGGAKLGSHCRQPRSTRRHDSQQVQRVSATSHRA
jgi:hypothetical protein